MKLVVGAGTRRVEGFVHHDIQHFEGIDIVCDFWELPEHAATGSCEEIHMTHVLEHLPMARTHDALLLLHGLLQDGGKLYLEVPNFLWQAQMLIEHPANRQIVEYAYGGQLNAYDYHYNGFTPAILASDLEAAQFRVTELRPNSSIECWAEKA